MARVLIVLDGDYRFSVGTATRPDFTYTVLVDALTAAGHQVTKAHRQTDASPGVTNNFNFATSVNLLDFDVLWLIGNQGRNVSSGSSTPVLPADQVAAIARFMEAGGGVFATGDHDSIGSVMCGRIPRVRSMRRWYGEGDNIAERTPNVPDNFPPMGMSMTGLTRADTTQRSTLSDYDLNNDGANENFVWFENQSDATPQPIVPTTTPTHPILRHAGNDITVMPDHMHEGDTLGEIPGYDYAQTVTLDLGGGNVQNFVEYPVVDGHREMPTVIATGQTVPFTSRIATYDPTLDFDGVIPTPGTINLLSTYDGRVSGVGRVVTGSTFHHYVDINLSGDSSVNTPAELALTGPDAAKNEGFGHAGAAPGTFDRIKAIFANITTWLARPRPSIQLILERSTFSQAEATANPDFDGAFLVVVDGLKPNQFPGGGITTLSPSQMQLDAWAPDIVPAVPAGISIVPTGVSSDAPGLPDRLQRITFTYRVTIGNAAFGFGSTTSNLQLDATLNSTAASAPMTDRAWMQLVKSGNPFMLDLANGNTTPWLSSDLRVFPVIAGGPPILGQSLAANASRSQALDFLRNLISGMSVAEFESLQTAQNASALSALPTTTGAPMRRVYNFAVARVRVPATGAAADDVRVFFRIFTSQTTAALTYEESPPGTPIRGYRRTGGANPIALPGTDATGNEWLSFPMFSAARVSPPESQTDDDNFGDLSPGTDTFFGALIDNNLNDPYLPPTPNSGGAPIDLPTLMMGEHQCIVAQIEYAGTPIPNGANPFTSDKLAQRNLALSEIANPGLDASRVALHTFEIEATPHAIGDGRLPDELLLDWRSGPPKGTEVQIHVPGWSADAVIALADRFYPRHDLRAVDAHTVALPGGGIRYLPIPMSLQRQTGVLSVQFPLGVKKGQRFDLSVRQITTRARRVPVPPTKQTAISLQEAAKLLQSIDRMPAAAATHRKKKGDDTLPRGVFALGDNRSLVTDPALFDGSGDHALIVEHPDPKLIARARRESAQWRETVGAFQLGIPVSVKADMIAHHLRLLSVLRWRLEKLSRKSRWHATFSRYVDLIAEKVRALGGDPWAVPATPDGVFPGLDNLPQPGGDGVGHEGAGDNDGGGAGDDPKDPFLEPGADGWLDGSNGLAPPDKAGAALWSGKISGLLYDHFGDFEGFTLESHAGAHRRFFSRETAIHDLARAAWRERDVVTVVTVAAGSRRVRRLLIRG